MTTQSCSARTIPGLWSRTGAVLLSLAWLAVPAARAAVPAAAGADLASLIKMYRDKPSAASRARLERFAALHAKAQDGALAQLALGIAWFEQKDYSRAIGNLKAAEARLPKIEDYTVYYLASAQIQARDETNIAKELARFQDLPTASPFAERAVVLQAKALVDLKDPAGAVRSLRERYADLPQPDTDLTLAMAYEAASDPATAAALYQRVYFGYPDTDAAARASAALIVLKDALGSAYPPPTPSQMLERGDKWLAAREYARARQEFASLVSQLTGLERDRARVRIGVADYQRGEAAAAYRYFESLDLDRSEAAAERLYYLAECQRHLNASDNMLATVHQLSEQYPQSPWRLKALVSAGNCYLVQNHHTARTSITDDGSTRPLAERLKPEPFCTQDEVAVPGTLAGRMGTNEVS